MLSSGSPKSWVRSEGRARQIAAGVHTLSRPDTTCSAARCARARSSASLTDAESNTTVPRPHNANGRRPGTTWIRLEPRGRTGTLLAVLIMMNSLWQDVRIAVRGYVKKPLFTLVVLAILGLGIGANSAIFTVVNAILLRPLEYPRASELIRASQINRDTGRRRSISPPNYFDLKDQSRAFSGVAAYWSPSVSISGAGGDPEKVLAATCSFDLFSVLGVSPIAGRGFVADDDGVGAPRVAVLGRGLWQRRFGGDTNAVGRELVLDGVPALAGGGR